MSLPFPVGSVVLARVIGLPCAEVRARVVRVLSDGSYVVRTADLVDVGTVLALDADRVLAFPGETVADAVYAHPSALVAIGGAS